MATYLDTLRRIPEDIFLAIFAQDFEEDTNAQCVCGWAVREQLARCANLSSEIVGLPTTEFKSFRGNTFKVEEDSFVTAHELFGGTEREWWLLWNGAIDHTRKLERAVVDRLNEIVAVRS